MHLFSLVSSFNRSKIRSVFSEKFAFARCIVTCAIPSRSTRRPHSHRTVRRPLVLSTRAGQPRLRRTAGRRAFGISRSRIFLQFQYRTSAVLSRVSCPRTSDKPAAPSYALRCLARHGCVIYAGTMFARLSTPIWVDRLLFVVLVSGAEAVDWPIRKWFIVSRICSATWTALRSLGWPGRRVNTTDRYGRRNMTESTYLSSLNICGSALERKCLGSYNFFTLSSKISIFLLDPFGNKFLSQISKFSPHTEEKVLSQDEYI